MSAPSVFVPRTTLLNHLMEQPRRYVPVVSYLMTPVALVGYAFAAWRIGADLGWVDNFFISEGIFSRWQVWLALGAATQVVSKELDKIGTPRNNATS
jgi:hypothetical protein